MKVGDLCRTKEDVVWSNSRKHARPNVPKGSMVMVIETTTLWVRILTPIGVITIHRAYLEHFE
jgi:hypothetical protein